MKLPGDQNIPIANISLAIQRIPKQIQNTKTQTIEFFRGQLQLTNLRVPVTLEFLCPLKGQNSRIAQENLQTASALGRR